jgi:hypothetical protein
MSRIFQRFSRYWNFHLRGEYIVVSSVWQVYLWQRVGKAFYVVELICGAEELDAEKLDVPRHSTRNPKFDIILHHVCCSCRDGDIG